MAVDLRSVTRAAAEAALGDVAPKKKGLSPWRALAIGAGLVTAGRIATGPNGRFLRGLVQGHSSNGSAEDEVPEARTTRSLRPKADEEPEAEGRRRARGRGGRRRARAMRRRRARSQRRRRARAMSRRRARARADEQVTVGEKGVAGQAAPPTLRAKPSPPKPPSVAAQSHRGRQTERATAAPPRRPRRPRTSATCLSNHSVSAAHAGGPAQPTESVERKSYGQ